MRVVEQDDIWRPDYDGPPPRSGPVAFDPGVIEEAAESDGASNAAAVGPKRRRSVEKVVAFVAVLGMAVVAVVVLRGESDLSSQVAADVEVTDAEGVAFRTDSTTLSGFETAYGGADFRGLAIKVQPTWSAQFPPLSADGGQNGITWVKAVDSDHVVVGTGDSRSDSGPSSVHVVDAATGEVLWSQQFELRIDRVEVVAAIDDALILIAHHTVVAYGVADGSQRWGAELIEFDGAVEKIERLAGTDFLLRSGPGPSRPLRLVDPLDGRSVASFSGEVLGTDGLGRWYVRRNDKITWLDFNDPAGGIVDFGPLASVDGDRIDFVTIVDERLVVGLDDELAYGPVTDARGRVALVAGLTPLVGGSGELDDLPIVQGVMPLGGPDFVVVGDELVMGAEFDGDDLRLGWRRSGTVEASYPTDRGKVLLLSDSDGDTRRLVEGRTGDTIAIVTATSDLLDVVGDGILMREITSDGTSIVGLDLDGEAVWSIDGGGPVSAGDRIVLRSEVLPDGSFTVTAFG